jgi:hypothetical protein
MSIGDHLAFALQRYTWIAIFLICGLYYIFALLNRITNFEDFKSKYGKPINFVFYLFIIVAFAVPLSRRFFDTDSNFKNFYNIFFDVIFPSAMLIWCFIPLAFSMRNALSHTIGRMKVQPAIQSVHIFVVAIVTVSVLLIALGKMIASIDVANKPEHYLRLKNAGMNVNLITSLHDGILYTQNGAWVIIRSDKVIISGKIKQKTKHKS